MLDINKFLHDKMRALGAETYRKFLCKEAIHNWTKLVDEDIAAKVTPVKIEHGVLFVNVSNSAFKDQLKFHAEEIIDAINEHFAQDGEPLVKDLRIAKTFQVADMPRDEQEPAQGAAKLTIEQITLTDEEIERCELRAAKISDDNLRQTVLDTLLSQARVQKFRLANGWHRCGKCEVLCPPEETFCEVCRIKQREAMVNELYKIMYDAPWLNARDVQELLLKRMPQMRSECSFDAIESARVSLIQKVAGAIRFGDEESDEVLKLVMLEKRLTPDKLTPAIIRRTLLDMQFNLADQALLLRYGMRNRRRNK